MSTIRLVVLATALLQTWAFSGLANAEESPRFEFSLVARGQAGFCCSLHAESPDSRIAEDPDGPQPAAPLGLRAPDAPYEKGAGLGGMLGVAGGIDAVLWRYAGLSLIGGFAALDIEAENIGFDRTWVVDMLAEPRVRYPFVGGELFVKVSLGLVQPRANQNIERHTQLRMSPDLGHSWGLAIGTAHYFNRWAGFSWEAGYRKRTFGYDVKFDYQFAGLSDHGHVELTAGQVFVSAGLMVNLWRSTE